MKKIHQPYLLLVILFISACTITLVPTYDAQLESEIINGAKLNDKLYIDLLNAESSKRNFQFWLEKYSEIEAEIHTILLKNEIRKNNTDMLAIVKSLDSAFVKYKLEHKNKPTQLTDGELIIYQSYIKAFWKPLLIAEGGLKKAKK
jgi:hypothetical protein